MPDARLFGTQDPAETVVERETIRLAFIAALQQARAVLAADRPEPTDLVAPEDPHQRDVLRRYVAAFESHDVAALTALLREDAVALMPPFVWSVTGRAQIAAVMAAGDACAGDRLVVTSMNVSSALGQCRPGEDRVLRPLALVLRELRGGRIARTVTFLGSAERFAELGLADHPDDR